jgi:hypothetical protein
VTPTMRGPGGSVNWSEGFEPSASRSDRTARDGSGQDAAAVARISMVVKLRELQ